MNSLRLGLEQYLLQRRSVGFQLRLAALALRRFVCFLEDQKQEYITISAALHWVRIPVNVQPATWALKLSMIRCWAKFMSALDPRTEIPPQSLLPWGYRRPKPYIYSRKEVCCLIKMVGDYHHKMVCADKVTLLYLDYWQLQDCALVRPLTSLSKM